MLKKTMPKSKFMGLSHTLELQLPLEAILMCNKLVEEEKKNLVAQQEQAEKRVNEEEEEGLWERRRCQRRLERIGKSSGRGA